MKKQILLSLIAAVSLFATDEAKKEEPKKEASNIEEAFKLASVNGQIRGVYQANSNDGTNNSTRDVLIGGRLGIETSPLTGFSAGATFYTSQPVSNKKDYKDGDYYNADNKGYSVLGEVFAKYVFEKGEVKLGHMELGLPLINSDDIRMVPDLYTAVLANYSLAEGVKLVAGVVTQMAGWENGSNETKFVKIGQVVSSAVSDGAVWDMFFAGNSSAFDSKLYLAGITYEKDTFALQGWFSRLTEIMDTYYAEGSFKAYDSELVAVSLVGQYMSEKSIGKLKSYNQANPATKIDCNIYGAAIELDSKPTGVKATLAYNKSDKKAGLFHDGGTTGFFGGGKDPLVTSMDVETANGTGGVTAIKYRLGYDFEKAGVAGLSATVAHANFDKLNAQMTKETDLTIAYSLSKKTNVEMMLTKIETTGNDDNNRARIFIKYDF